MGVRGANSPTRERRSRPRRHRGTGKRPDVPTSRRSTARRGRSFAGPRPGRPRFPRRKDPLPAPARRRRSRRTAPPGPRASPPTAGRSGREPRAARRPGPRAQPRQVWSPHQTPATGSAAASSGQRLTFTNNTPASASTGHHAARTPAAGHANSPVPRARTARFSDPIRTDRGWRSACGGEQEGHFAAIGQDDRRRGARAGAVFRRERGQSDPEGRGAPHERGRQPPDDPAEAGAAGDRGVVRGRGGRRGDGHAGEFIAGGADLYQPDASARGDGRSPEPVRPPPAAAPRSSLTLRVGTSVTESA